jgi:tetratricopeptide (TPR) repeat protein
LRDERDNLRTALAWAQGSAGSEPGLRLVGALRDFWYYAGHVSEGVSWIDRALARAEQAPLALRAKALNAAGLLAFAQGNYARGKRFHREALALSQEAGDKVSRAWALVFLGGFSSGYPGEYQEAIALCEEGLALFRELGDQPGMTRALNALGELARLEGDYERAGAVYEECLAMSRETGDRQREAIMLANLAYVAQRRGDYERAEALIIEALNLCKFRYCTATALAMLAGPVEAQGRPDRAARLLGASEALFEAMGTGLHPADQFEIDRYVAAVREQLDQATFEAAWAEGRAMSLEEAIVYALGEEAG